MKTSQGPTIALLISTYNWPEALQIVLDSVLEQEVLPDEILIADDGSGIKTQDLIDSYRPKFSIPLKHFWHKDDGFRKTIIMNKALAGADADYIVQIDGDMLLHPRFIADHAVEAFQGFYVKGSRAMLTEAKTKEILLGRSSIRPHAFQRGVYNRINALHMPSFSFFFYNISKRSDNLRGCNCAFWKEDFVKVNGYNNNLVGWGHEDIELAARFVNSGLYQRQLKMKAVAFHLFHAQNSRHQEMANLDAYYETVKGKVATCLSGYREGLLATSC